MKRVLMLFLTILMLSSCELGISDVSRFQSISTTDVESIIFDVNEEENVAKVRFIDVGQGESVFVELPDGSIMLIDAAEIMDLRQITRYRVKY